MAVYDDLIDKTKLARFHDNLKQKGLPLNDWATGNAYKIGYIVVHNGELYRKEWRFETLASAKTNSLKQQILISNIKTKEKKLLDRQGAAKFLGTSLNTVDRYKDSGKVFKDQWLLKVFKQQNTPTIITAMKGDNDMLKINMNNYDNFAEMIDGLLKDEIKETECAISNERIWAKGSDGEQAE
jgi:hypothetical protein